MNESDKSDIKMTIEQKLKKLNTESFNDEEIEKIFKNFDPLTHNILTKEEVFTCLEKLNLPKKVIKKVFHKLDTNKTNNVTLSELNTFIHDQELELFELFRKIDKNHDGKLTFDDMKKSLNMYYPNRKFTNTAIENVIRHMDANKDGAIEFTEWRKFLLFLPDLDLEYIMEWGGETSALLNNIYDAPPISMITENVVGDHKFSFLKWTKNFLAGGVAGAVSRTITAPLERLKILYQVNYKSHSNPPNIINGLKEIFKNDGFTGLFRGNLINILKATPDTAIKFAVFESLKHLMRKDPDTNLTSFQLFLAGATSGLVSNFCVFPLDVLKTRFAAAPTGTYSSISDAIKKILKKEGRIKPFFNGFQATLCAALPNSGINLMTYEFLKRRLYDYYDDIKQEVPVSLFMLIGAFSAVLASSLMYPWQLVTSRIIMQGLKEGRPKKGMIHIMKDVWYREGGWGFYKGFRPAMTKIVLGNGIAYSSYETCKKYLGLT